MIRNLLAGLCCGLYTIMDELSAYRTGSDRPGWIGQVTVLDTVYDTLAAGVKCNMGFS